ncbi:MAG: hypothetical protein A3K30_03180 [Deltaproteobacteria bacterium RBG_13_51_10]|nr:MAG: hypothetical protein A3K30_03180 [Deltaproteobacteria bacterium RBG_13_51_10]
MNQEPKTNTQPQQSLKTMPIPPPPLMSPGPINVPASAPPPPPPPPRQEETKRRNPLLNRWSIILSEAEPHEKEDPGRIRVRLQGEIQGHPNPRFTDGEVIQSSELIGINVDAKTAKTKHTIYDLGEVDPTFLEYVQGLGKQLSDYNFSLRGDKK